MNSACTWFVRVFSSPRFFVAIMVLFVLQALYFALSSVYPMVFDENTHFGIIQLHATQLSPLFAEQPANAGYAGPLTRDPSYLFRYILSFPYRLTAHFTDSLMIQVVVLRLFNIGFFAAGLVLFRKLMLKTKAHVALINITLLFFILIPVVPMLAGQINYDNLLLPFSALLLLSATGIIDRFRKNDLPISQILIFLTIGMLGCLTQFSYLPFFTGTFLWLCWEGWRNLSLSNQKVKSSVGQFWSISWTKKAIIVISFALASGLFVQMYGVNAVKYHNLVPACDQVLDQETCSRNGNWSRNRQAYLNKDSSTDYNPVLFSVSWVYRMLISNFYTSSGGAPQAMYLSINPLPVAFITALGLFVFGIGLVIFYNRKLVKSYNYFGLLLFVVLFYGFVLWARNYQDFTHLGLKVAINGRYIIPVLIPAMLIIAAAYHRLLTPYKRLAIVSLLCGLALLLQGGGATHYIVSSQPSWYWQKSTIIKTNQQIKTIVNPLIIIKTPIRPID